MDGPSEVEAQLPFNHAIIGKGLANGAYANGDRMAPAAFDLSLLLPQEPILRHLSDIRTVISRSALGEAAITSSKKHGFFPQFKHLVKPMLPRLPNIHATHYPTSHTMSVTRTIIGEGSAYEAYANDDQIAPAAFDLSLPLPQEPILRHLSDVRTIDNASELSQLQCSANGAYTNGYRMAPAALDLNLLLQHKPLLNQLAAVQTMDNASEMEAQLACRKQQKDLYELARAISHGEATEDDERAAEAIRSNHRRRRKRPPTKTKETTAEDEEPLPKTKETIDEDKKDAEAIRNRDFLIS
ncbi:hypothetical protein AK830_g10444 [Neonectria ditissima]|uniref:Uncharacterized protein n=1 Tax=Neonectria ditissima TaxID=78410 RepID=A0A0P7B3N9_9HYPO|nr:hypothetical protein AK830_g10444 [Neonectria ditissima]